MGARPVTMAVKNFTRKLLILDSKKPEHGKFVTDPPSTIEAEGVWKCSDNDGAMMGPKRRGLLQNCR